MSTKISTILDQIDSEDMTLPMFQRGYVWKKDQVKQLFDSLYKRHPVGGLLVWDTDAKKAIRQGKKRAVKGNIKFILDGQQRITSLYGVFRGKPPKFFDTDGKEKEFTGLYFNIKTEEFDFYQAKKMNDNPFWVDITSLVAGGDKGITEILQQIPEGQEKDENLYNYIRRLEKIREIENVDLHVEMITDKEITLDIIVEIFNRINSRGTKLSAGDLALAKVCVKWPEAREKMKEKLYEWSKKGYNFKIDFLLRCVNTVLNSKSNFKHLDDVNSIDIQNGLERTSKHIDTCLNMISGRLGLDCQKVLDGHHSGIPVMVNYIEKTSNQLDVKRRDKLLFWFAQAGMWGRYAGPTETNIDQDISALSKSDYDVGSLLKGLQLWYGSLRVKSGHLVGRNTRFYRIFYMLTRMSEARDWGTGLPLKADLLGKTSSLEYHHIFPQSQLRKHSYDKEHVNGLANLCFLTKATNLKISNRLPKDYFIEIEKSHPGALESQWIPENRKLWEIENFLQFLEVRRDLIAQEINNCFKMLLHEDVHWLSDIKEENSTSAVSTDDDNADETEEQEIEKLNDWMEKQGLPRGEVSFDFANPADGSHMAVFDLAWPDGLQTSLTEPVAVMLDADANVIALASRSGFRCFTAISDLRDHIKTDILKEED